MSLAWTCTPSTAEWPRPMSLAHTKRIFASAGPLQDELPAVLVDEQAGKDICLVEAPDAGGR